MSENYLRFNPTRYGTPFHCFWAESPAMLAIADAAEITSWENLGSDGSAAEGTTGTVPTMDYTGINGHPSALFSGEIELKMTGAGSQTQPYTVVAVAQSSDISTNHIFLGSQSNNLIFGHRNSSGQKFALYSPSTWSDGPTADTDAHVFGGVIDGTSTTMNMDGVFAWAGTTGTADFLNAYIGSRGDLASDYDGHVAFVAIYSGDVTGNGWYKELIQGLINYYTTTPPALGYQPYLRMDPLGLFDWHSLFWAEGKAFIAQGIADAGAVTTWDNETGESEPTQATPGDRPLYRASHASLNSRPAIDFVSSDLLESPAFSVNPSYASGLSIVVIAAVDDLTANHSVVDGRNDGKRNLIRLNHEPSDVYIIYAGGTSRTGGSSDTDAHLAVGFFDGSTGNDSLAIDGSLVISGNDTGAQQITGVTIGADGAGTNTFNGGVSLVGLFEGVIEAHANWPIFKAWVEDHYAIPIS